MSIDMRNAILLQQTWVAIWNWYSSPLDVRSNVRLPSLNTRCHEECKNAFLLQEMWGAIWNYHSWALDVNRYEKCHSSPTDVSSNMKLPSFTTRYVSSNVKLPLLTTRCHEECEIAILLLDMSGAIWNCHSWPLDVMRNVKLPFLTTRCQQQCQITILDH